MKKNKTAIIFGISGQDGAYLSSLLLSKGYKVIGTSRNINTKNLNRLIRLDTYKNIKLYEGQATKYNFCNKVINKDINEIYYLAGDSSVIKSFQYPEISLKSNALGILNILNVVKKKNKKIRIFNAASGQFFGNNKYNKYNVNSKIDPQSPYGVAKAAGYWFTKIYRENFGLFCCSGILFNHESSLRSDEFVTKKIINEARKIKKKKKKILELGDINIYRDWGWAPEYVEAFWLMLRLKKPIDLVIGTGKIHSLKDFVKEVFKLEKLSQKKIRTNVRKFKRKLDIKGYKADISLTKKIIKWYPKTSFKQIVYKMVNNELF